MENKPLVTPVLLPKGNEYNYDPCIWTADSYMMKYIDKFLSAADMALGYQPQHLYLVSDMEIKEGDWCYHRSHEPYTVGKASKQTIMHWGCKKIEATTDKSLGLPLIPQSFIEEYVQKQRNIGKVYISFEESYQIPDCYDEQQWREESVEEKRKYIRKEVIILPVKDSWNREDMKQAYNAGLIEGNRGENKDYIPWEFDEWFDKNY